MSPAGDQEAPVENQTWSAGARGGGCFMSHGVTNLPDAAERRFFFMAKA